MVNLFDPVPLAVIVLLITTAIIAAVVLSGGNKKDSEKSNSPAVARTVKAEEPIAPKTQPVAKETIIAAKDVKPILFEKVVQESGERTRSVDSVSADNLEREESDKDEVVPVAAKEPTLPKSEEQEDVASELAYTHVATTEENGSEAISSDPAETVEGAAADDDMKEEEQADAQPEQDNQPEDYSQYQSQSNQDGQDEQVENEGEEVLERYAEAETGEPEEEEVAEYDESEYHPEDVNQDFYYDEDQEERPSLTLDTCHSGDASSATTPLSKSSRSLSTDPSGDVSAGLSPMKNSSSYKFGSHYQHKKVGASWVKDGNSQGSFSAASPVTVSPVRHSLPRKVIPVSDQDKPLSTKQSTKISQYEEGLQAEKDKVSSKVLETRRRTIEDVVNRVLLDGEVHLPSELDPTSLIVDPAEVIVDVKTKKIVKEMKAKFDTSEGTSSGNGGGRSTSVDYNN